MGCCCQEGKTSAFFLKELVGVQGFEVNWVLIGVGGVDGSC